MRILRLNKKAKRIVTVLDMMHEIYPDNFGKLDKSAEYKKEAVRLADGIISISHSTKKDLIEILKVPEDKIKVIHLGNSLISDVDEEPIYPFRYLLYVAKREGYKNFKMFVEVFAKIKKSYPDLKIVCSGGGDFTSEELNLFDSLGIRNDMNLFMLMIRCLQIYTNMLKRSFILRSTKVLEFLYWKQ